MTKKELVDKLKPLPDHAEVLVEIDSPDLARAYDLHPVQSIIYVNTPHEPDGPPIPSIILARWVNN